MDRLPEKNVKIKDLTLITALLTTAKVGDHTELAIRQKVSKAERNV